MTIPTIRQSDRNIFDIEDELVLDDVEPIDTNIPDWLKNFYNSLVFSGLLDHCWIAGGSLRSILVKDRIKDIDCFSSDPEKLVKEFEKRGFSVVFETKDITNFKFFQEPEDDPDLEQYAKLKNLTFQVVKKHTFTSLEETCKSFDFSCVKAGFGLNSFYADERFYLDNAQKALVLNGEVPYPLSTFERTLRYVGRGYTMCPTNRLILMKKVHEMTIDWDNPDENTLAFYPNGHPRFGGID